MSNDILREKSCGAIVYRMVGSNIEVIVLRMNYGHWSLPKGHMEGQETEHETALREVKEETGLDVEFVGDFRETIIYSPKPNTIKQVVFFLATNGVGTLRKDDREINEIHWMDIGRAIKTVTYQDDKEILKKAREVIKGIK